MAGKVNPLSSSSGSEHSLSEKDRDALGRDLAGPVLLPGDDGYVEEVAGFNRVVTHRPSLVVGATCAADVQAAVRFAGAHGLPTAVLATGHGPSMVIDDSVLITTRRMDDVTIDPIGQTARVDAGVCWGQAVDAAARSGLAPLTGSSPTVGVVGYTLGGGLCVTMGRARGWASDHVRSIDVVTADGVLRHTSPDSEPDLFWALRGGKSNFGVVTALEFALFPVRRIYAGGLVYAGEHAPAVLHAYQQFTTRVPDELTSSIALIRMPDVAAVPEILRGRLTVHVRISYLGSEADGRDLIAPMRAVAPALTDSVRDRPYTEFSGISPGPAEPRATVDNFAGLAELTPATVDAILEFAGPGTDPGIDVIDIRQLGGALARQSGPPSAVVNRDAAFVIFAVASVGNRGSNDRPVSGLDLMHRLGPWLARRKIANFLTPADATVQGTRIAFDEPTYARLRSVKARYDPWNIFRFNHNIPPDGAEAD
jgi:FAD/FMN-containing dehydrogenase